MYPSKSDEQTRFADPRGIFPDRASGATTSGVSISLLRRLQLRSLLCSLVIQHSAHALETVDVEDGHDAHRCRGDVQGAVAVTTSRRTSNESLMHYDQAGEYRSAGLPGCPLKLTTPCIVSNARHEADSASRKAMPLSRPSYAGVCCLNMMLQVRWCMCVFRRLVCMRRSGI
jgi:hypothetical protein